MRSNNWWMLRDSRGRPNAMLTFAAGAVVGVIVKFVIAGAVVTIAGHTFNGGSPPDPTMAGVLLAATLGSYVRRRGQDHEAAAKAPPAANP